MRTAPWRALGAIRAPRRATYYLPLTPHSSLLTPHYSLLTAHQVPFVYHLVLYAGRLTAAQRAPADTAFFAINVAAFVALAVRCWPCSASRATKGRIKTLLLQFILTFVVQMLMVGFAFGRYASLTAAKGLVAPGWIALWLIYLVGILAKGSERPR
jgi:hypothetical protein